MQFVQVSTSLVLALASLITTSTGLSIRQVPSTCRNSTSHDGYAIECGTHYVGQDLFQVDKVGSFEGCATLCDRYPGCYGWTWYHDGTENWCFLKDLPGEREFNEKYDSGVISSPKTPAGSQSCATLGNGSITDGFKLRCDHISASADLREQQAFSFGDCIDICRTDPDCVAVDYLGKEDPDLCLLKKNAEAGVDSEYGDYAYKI